MGSIYFIVLIIVIVNIAKIHCQDEEQSIVKLFKQSTVEVDPLQQKREQRLPPKRLTVEFEAFERTFYIVIERQSRIISAETQIIVHSKKKNREAVRYEGTPYAGRLVKIVPKPSLAAMQNKTEQIDRAPLARFYVKQSAPGQLEVTGGFIFDGIYYKVQQQQPNPFEVGESLKMRMLHSSLHKRKPMAPPIILISRDGGDSDNKVFKCGSHGSHETSGRQPDLFAAALFANQTRKYAAQSTATGCPKSRKILYVAVVADCGFVQKMAGDLRAIQAAIVSDFNLVSGIYEREFNLELGISALHIMEDCWSAGGHQRDDGESVWNRPCPEAPAMDARLNAFSEWRGTQPDKTAGIYHLVTGCLANEVVGIAWLNQVCNTKSIKGQKGQDDVDTVSGTSMSALIRNQFAVIAHEIGHNLGAVHDCTADVCSQCRPGQACSKCCECGRECDCGGRFVMSPESGGMNVSGFSECAKADICRKMPVLGSCFREPGTFKTIGKGVCGDGIRDENEECDCGGEEGCRGNPCCLPTCKLRPGARCDDRSDRCCRSCQVVPSEARKECSLKAGFCTEMAICDGVSRDCPKPSFLPDGAECPTDDASQGQCASGICTNRDLQCRAVGQRLGLTVACPATGHSCRMICAAADKASFMTSCTMIDADFIDGTKCGHKGFCRQGSCSESAVSGMFYQFWWLWAIVGAVTLLIVLVYLGRLIATRCRSRRHPRPIIQ